MEYENIMAVLDRRIGEMQQIIDYYREHTKDWEKELNRLEKENTELKNRIADLENSF